MLNERISQVLLAVVLIGPCLAVGAVHPLTLAVFLGLAALTLLFVAIGRKGFAVARFDLPTILLGVLVIASLLQITPLPASIVQLISPGAWEVQSGALSPLGRGAPDFMLISLDRTLTLMDTAKLLLVFCVYLTASIWTKRFGSTFLIQVIVTAGIITTAVFIGHRALLADTFFGFYEPHHTVWSSESIYAPLVNPNHLAALLGATAAIAIGYAQEVESKSTRVLLISISVLIGGALLLTLSRGGIAAFIAGQLVFITLILANRRRQSAGPAPSSRRRSFFELTAALLAAIAVGLFAAQDLLVQEFAGGDLSKLELLRESLAVLHRFPLTGSGRGTFGVAFPLVSDYAGGRLFTHPENAVVQALADFGWILGSIALIGGLVIFGLILKAGMKRPRDGAAIAALSAFGLHNLLDFNMETPAVAVIIATILATQMGRRSLKKLAGPHIPKVAFYVLGLVALAVAVGSGIYLPGRYLDEEQRRYGNDMGDPDSKIFEEEACAEALERHPADWYLPFAVGAHRYHHSRWNPLPWLSRAIRLNYASAGAHLYVGRYLLKKDLISQGLLELRLAVTYNPQLLHPAARFAVAASPSFEQLREIAHQREQKELLWPALARELHRVGKTEEAEQADLAVLELLPDNTQSLNRHARYLAAQGDMEQAFAVARRLPLTADAGTTRAHLLADLYLKTGDIPRAIGELTGALEKEPRRRSLLAHLARVHTLAGDHEAALHAAGRMVAFSETKNLRSAALALKANLHANAGNYESALATYRQASRENPKNKQALVNIARIAERLGDTRRATEALRALRDLEPTNPEWPSGLKRLRDRERRQRLGI